MKATVLLLFILAAIVCISEARNEIDGQEVVQASEILAKIERGELVNYSQKTIEGDINLSDLKLPKIRINRTMDEIEYHGLSENQTIVESMLFFQDCLVKQRTPQQAAEHVRAVCNQSKSSRFICL